MDMFPELNSVRAEYNLSLISEPLGILKAITQLRYSEYATTSTHAVNGATTSLYATEGTFSTTPTQSSFHDFTTTPYWNQSEPQCDLSYEFVSASSASLVTIILNFLALSTLCVSSSDKEGSHHHIILTALVINDLVAALVFAIASVSSFVLGCAPLGGEGGCAAFGWMLTATLMWSPRLVLLITLERYLSIVQPLFHYRKVTARCMVRCLLLGFVITGIEASLPLTGSFPPFIQYTGSLVCGYNTSSPAGDIKHHLLLLAFGIESVFTVAVICACNLHVGLVLQRSWSTASTATSVWTMHAETWNRRANSLSAAVLVGSAIHCVCYIPIALQLFYSVITQRESNGWTHALSVGLLLTGPFFNTLIYVVCNRHYRQCLWESFLFVLKCGRRKPTPTIRPYGSHESVDRRLSNVSTSSMLSWIPDQTVTRNN